MPKTKLKMNTNEKQEAKQQNRYLMFSTDFAWSLFVSNLAILSFDFREPGIWGTRLTAVGSGLSWKTNILSC